MHLPQITAVAPKKLSKLALLLQLLLDKPSEFRDRLLNIVDSQADRLRAKASATPVTPEVFIRRIEDHLQTSLAGFLNEAPLQEIQARVAREKERLRSNPVFDMFHNPGSALPPLCYALCRALRPAVVVETGVAHGVTSAYLLQALVVNGAGELWSIDLPPLANKAEDEVGTLVPAELRSRWHLLRGLSRRVLPQLVRRLPAIDIFLHDSLHTYRNMALEYRTVWPKLRPGGALLSDDVELNRAFETFAAKTASSHVLTAREWDKSAVFGILFKDGT